jgi:RNA recognition motif-containing protein
MNGVIKGVAFVDFFKKEHMEKILNTLTKFKIGFSVLDIEKKKN